MFKIFILVIMFARQVSAFSLSADEMYRDLLNYEDKSPPDVIVNRTAPDVTPFKDDEKFAPPPAVETKIEEKKETVRNKELEETYQKMVEQKKKEELEKWKKIVRSVQKNQATAFDIAEIKKKANLNDPEAVELLAWMYTTGNGVPQNLINAYDLYLKAYTLGIKDAAKNAELVFKTMPGKERRRLPNFAE